MPRLLLLAFVIFALSAARATEPGATPIDESLVITTLHVAPSGDDSTGNGSPAAPFRSISRGLSAAHTQYNAANLGVRVLVQPGTYREGTPGGQWAIAFPSPATAAPVILEGAGWNPAAPANTGDVIVSGSENWSGGWAAVGNGTWTKTWPYNWGASPLNGSNPPAPEAFRRYELVHVDGQTYYQIAGPTDTAALAKLTATEGAFWVDENTDLITIRPPATVTDLNTRLVEVTTKRKLLYHYRSSTATSDTNIIIRNLVFQHAAPGLMHCAVHLQNPRNVLVEDCIVRNNKHSGLNMDMRAPYTVRRVSVTGNGEFGAQGRGRSALWEDCDFSYNARQAHISGYYSWTVCGIKLGDAQNTVIRRSRASYNSGFGFWWDTGCFRSELSDSAATHNFASGVFIEFNNNLNPETPPLGNDTSVLVRNTVLAHNRRPAVGTYMGRGAVMSENENAVFDHVIFHNNDNQLGILENSRGPQGRTVIKNSVLSATTSSQLLYANAYGTSMWQQFFDNLDAETNDNRYFHPDAVAFPDRNQNVSLNLAGWRSAHLYNANNVSADRAVDSRSFSATSGYSGQPLVGIHTINTYVAEAGGTGSFTVSRASADLSSPLLVQLEAPAGTGFATPGSDYAAIGASVTIPAGQHHAVVQIVPVADALAEGDEIVRLQLAASAAYVLGRASAEFTLVDAQTPGLPDLSVTATSPLAAEQGAVPGVFTLSRTGNFAEPLLVRYTLSGSATSGTDYVASSGTLSIPAGQASATLPLVPTDDALPELDETIILTLVADSAYRLGAPGFPSAATLTLHDNDAVPHSPIQVQVAADGTATASLTLHNPATSAQTFTLTLPSFTDYTIATSNDPGGPVYQWTELNNNANGSTRLTSFNDLDDTLSAFVDLGFNFPLYGASYSNLLISSNGVLYFGASPGWAPYSNTALPSSAIVNSQTNVAAIAFFWDDLRFLTSGQATPSTAWFARLDAQTFVLQFQDVRHYSDITKSITTQAILHASGEIVLQYKSITFDQARLGATIGIQDAASGTPRATQVAYNSNYVTADLAVRLTPPVRWLTAASTNLTIPAGSSATLTLTFDATGLPVGTLRSAPIILQSNLAAQPAVSITTQMTVVEPTAPPPPPVETTVTFTEGSAGYTHTAATIRSGQPSANFGTNAQLIVGLVNGTDRMRAALSFPLTGIPPGSLITDVSLELKTSTQAGQGTLGPLELRALADSPAEAGVTWQMRDASNAWTTPGGDALAPALSTLAGFDATITGATRTFPGTTAFAQAVQTAHDQNRPLNLLLLCPSAEAQSANQFTRFASDDETTQSLRPLLRVTYRALASLSPWELWLVDHGLPLTSDPQAVLPGDTQPALLLYALAQDPASATASSLASSHVANDRLQTVFYRAAADVDYHVEASSDLNAWTVIATNPGNIGQLVTVSDPEPLSQHPRRFLRIRVTLLP